MDKLSKPREEIEHINGEIQAAQQAYDLNRAAELQYGKLPELKKHWKRRRRASRARI